MSPQRRRRGAARGRWISLGLAAALALGLACGVGDGDDGDQPDDGGQELTNTGRDGAFEFTVDSMECGETVLGEEPLTEEAQGEFCLVELTVQNIGDEAQTMDLTVQRAFDSTDNAYDAVQTIEIGALNPEVWYNPINPGNSVTGSLVYDVPPGTELVRLELHDSAFSEGVDVAIP